MGMICKFCLLSFVSKYSTQRFCSLTCSNRYNLNNKNSVTLPVKYTADLSELFGILLGDGSVTKYFAKVYLNAIADAEYVSFVETLASGLFPGASVTIQERTNHGTTEIQISSKDVCDYLYRIGFSPKERYIPSWIKMNDIFIKSAVRGLFDTEGSVGIKYFRGKHGNYLYKQLTVTNKNKNILAFLEQSLIRFGYRPTKKSQKNIYLSNHPDIDRYLDEIGSHNPKIVRKINTEEIDGFSYGGLRRMVRHQS